MSPSIKNLNPLPSKLAEQINTMLAYWDSDCVCRYANKAYLDWFGKKKEDVINQSSMKDLLGPLYDINKAHIEGALAGHIQTFEREAVLPSGETHFLLASYYPDKRGNEIIGFHAHITDVTALKMFEKKLLKSNQIILNQNQRLLNFSNVISHNLKAYSDGLSSLVDVLKEANSEEEKEKVMGLLSRLSERFRETIAHLNEIVAAQNQASLNYEEVYLHDYIDKAIDILQVQIDQKEASVHNHVARHITLNVNPAYMESILLNFLSNGIKYSDPNRKPIVELSAVEDKDEVLLTVKDNGIGIDLKKHGEDLFGMYKTFAKNDDAHGIGLFITKYQIEIMGGEVSVESQLGVGTTFTIRLNVNN